MVFQSFGMLSEVQESTGTALCSSKDLPWVSAKEFWRKRGKYPPSVSDLYKVSAFLTPSVTVTH